MASHNIIQKDVDIFEHRASILAYYIKTRVSHTQLIVSNLIRCGLSLAKLYHMFQTPANFTKMLADGLMQSVDPHGGSFEIQTYEDGSIWIKGAFHTSELRKYLMTIPQEHKELELKPNGK